jgi:hypothetical protein
MTILSIVDLKERIAISDDFSLEERKFLLRCIDLAITQKARELDPAAAAEMHAPPNYLGRIDAIWAALSLDEGGEGVCAAPMGGMTLPLIAADKRRLEQIIPIARRIATLFGKPVRLAKFTRREDVEIYQPGQSNAETT